ncbi:MAG TPA: hypothetical protein VK604_19215 [Bryobacteraceae bacterium]|nr:hypothetical protein [Bryobacteraceae bacterium]
MPVTARTTFQFFRDDRSVSPSFRTGVSLHSHTMYSEESLDMVPRYTAHVPYLGRAIRRQEAEYHQKTKQSFDFGHAFWTPPLAPRQAFRVEEKQIQRKLQLPALVSLTDHDDIRAGSQLHVLDRFAKSPISTEWTIPFGETFFHLGVHNLPSSLAGSIVDDLARFTAEPLEEKLGGLLEMLNAHPGVLLVLNHPLWDEKGIGAAPHAQFLAGLLELHGHWFHALELNGLRGWNENHQVIALGRKTGLPLVSGGDRHGREPNAILSLSRAMNFAELAQEVRHERFSHVVFMPQYHEPLRLRILQTMIDVVRDYPENFVGRQTWADRVFYRNPETEIAVPLASIWKDGGPMIVKQFVGAMRFFEWRGVRSALRVALHDRSDRAWSNPVWSDGEAAI